MFYGGSTSITSLSLRETDTDLLHRQAAEPILTLKKIHEMLFARHFIFIISHFRVKLLYFDEILQQIFVLAITCSESNTIRPITSVKKVIIHWLVKINGYDFWQIILFQSNSGMNHPDWFVNQSHRLVQESTQRTININMACKQVLLYTKTISSW